jgi:hypothetical protein
MNGGRMDVLQHFCSSSRKIRRDFNAHNQQFFSLMHIIDNLYKEAVGQQQQQQSDNIRQQALNVASTTTTTIRQQRADNKH